jgi:hypothetical protein
MRIVTIALLLGPVAFAPAALAKKPHASASRHHPKASARARGAGRTQPLPKLLPPMPSPMSSHRSPAPTATNRPPRTTALPPPRPARAEAAEPAAHEIRELRPAVKPVTANGLSDFRTQAIDSEEPGKRK